MNRRQILAGMTALPIGNRVASADALQAPKGVSAANNPDAELIALCDEYCVLEKRYRSLFDGAGRLEDEKERDLAIEPIDARQTEIAERVNDLPTPATPAGLRAAARAFDASAFNLPGKRYSSTLGFNDLVMLEKTMLSILEARL